MHYFSIFSKTFNKPCVNFCAFGGKRQVIGNFEKIFENFEKTSEGNCKNALFLADFQ